MRTPPLRIARLIPLRRHFRAACHDRTCRESSIFPKGNPECRSGLGRFSRHRLDIGGGDFGYDRDDQTGRIPNRRDQADRATKSRVDVDAPFAPPAAE